MDTSWALAITFGLFGSTISTLVAMEKRRSVPGWLVFGALLPLISVVAILCVPSLKQGAGSEIA